MGKEVRGNEREREGLIDRQRQGVTVRENKVVSFFTVVCLIIVSINFRDTG